MRNKSHVHPSDLRGVSRLAIDATLGLTDLVETMHHNIMRVPGILGTPTQARTRGIPGLVYASIRGVTRLVGSGLDASLAFLSHLPGELDSSAERDALLAALNGVLGDYLAATDNPLSISMQLRQDGHPLDLTRPALTRPGAPPSGKILLLAHGLCLNDHHWRCQGHDHGAALAADLGYTPVYLRYNTGLHISTNGRVLADQLETLVQRWPRPVDELVILGHSMGGLVARSAGYYGGRAGHTWLRSLRKLVFLGTPHHGAPLERVGNWVNVLLDRSPYTTAFARLGKARSAGITDLRYGAVRDEEWAAPNRLAQVNAPRQPTPLPRGVQCYAIGATTGQTANDLRDQLLGDGLVPLSSALGRHPDPRLALPLPATQQWVGYAMHHLDLLHRRDVYTQVRHWLAA